MKDEKMKDEIYKILEARVDTLQEYMADKSSKISEAIGEVGLIHMEAVAVVLENYLNAIRSCDGFQEKTFELIKKNTKPYKRIFNHEEIAEKRKLDILSKIRREI